MSIRLAVLVSGGGTTLSNLLGRIADGRLDASVELVVSSDPNAGALEKARRAGVRAEVVSAQGTDIASFSGAIFDHCRHASADLVVLGGFLKRVRIPADFRGRVLNIHPALIPAFCGAGFYGRRVHEAVLARGVKLSGCTVHFADDEYDHGPIILQRAVPVLEDDTPESLADRVFRAECDALPEAIRLIAKGLVRIEGTRTVVDDDDRPGNAFDVLPVSGSVTFGRSKNRGGTD